MSTAAAHHREKRIHLAVRSMRWVMILVTVVVGVVWFRLVPRELYEITVPSWGPILLAVVWLSNPRRGRGCIQVVLGVGALLGAVFGGFWLIARIEPYFTVEASQLRTAHLVWIVTMIAAPLIRALLRPMQRRAARRDQIETNRRREIDKEQTRLREQNRQSAPTATGSKTGFEPATLRGTALRPAALMFGDPDSPEHPAQLQLAKSLQLAGLSDRFATFWMVRLPSDDRSRGDVAVGCVLVSSGTVWLLHPVVLPQGDVTWRTEQGRLICIDNQTGSDIGRPSDFDEVAQIAAERVRRRLAELGLKLSVRSRMVFLPDDQGIGKVEGVSWPGDVPALTLGELLAELDKESAFNQADPNNEHVIRIFRWSVAGPQGPVTGSQPVDHGPGPEFGPGTVHQDPTGQHEYQIHAEPPQTSQVGGSEPRCLLCNAPWQPGASTCARCGTDFRPPGA